MLVANRRQVPLPDKGIGVGGTTFMGGLEGVSSHLVLDPVTRISVQ